MSETLHNWAGNLRYGTDRVHRPKTVDEVADVVRKNRKLKVLGTRHCFNGIADSSDAFVSLENMNRVVGIDRVKSTVTVEAGIKYGELGEHLHREGFALRNLASLPHISVAGACATATHGSGEKNGNLATSVVAMQIVKADGDVVEVSRDNNGEEFQGMVVGLGGLGVVTQLSLEIVPTFEVWQYVYQHLPVAQLEEHFDEIQSSAYSVSMFTDWQSDSINQVWLKRRVKGEAPVTLFGARLADRDLHPIEEISAENCTPQMGVAGPWHERLPHFRMGFMPSSGQELQAEYFVSRGDAVEALRAVSEIRNQIAPLLFISEIRTIAADELWMSPCYRRESVAIHFTLKQDQRAVEGLLEKIEKQLERFDARPHWGKLFVMSAERLRSLYLKIGDFREMMVRFDPGGKFRNAFLDRYIFESNPEEET